MFKNLMTKFKKCVIGSTVTMIGSSSCMVIKTGDGPVTEIQASGIKSTKIFKLSFWNQIDFDSIFDVDIIITRSQIINEVEIIADQNVIPYLHAHVDYNILNPRFTQNIKVIGNTIPIKFIFRTSNLINIINYTGTGDLNVSGIGLPDRSQSLTINLDGTGDVNLHGNIFSLYANVNGTGDLNANGLVVGSCKINIEGTGDSTIDAKSISGTLSGTGDLYVPKNAKVNIKNDGVGYVRRY